MNANHQTIAAIATAPGRGGVAVIRMSGPDAFAIAAKIAGTVPEPGRFRYATFRSPDSERTLLDAGLVLAFKAPHSYTGEDVVEFQCHGGVIAPRRVLEACFAAGAHAARRGEFTERAFLNGRLDYDQAESVLNLIDAKTDRAAEAALEGLGGQKHRELRDLYDATLDLSSTVEHALDVDEGDIDPDAFCARVNDGIAALRKRIDAQLATWRAGRILREGALVVLAGPPNAGKSSLMNALLGENRAIVSDIAGTTRDSIEEWLDLDGWPVRLVDTAGLRETEDAIEAEGVRRAETLMREAAVVVRLTPADEAPCKAEGSVPTETTGSVPSGLGSVPKEAGSVPCVLDIISKADLLSAGVGVCPHPVRLRVSVRTGEGLPELRSALVAALSERAAEASDGELADVHAAALHEARALLPEDACDLVLTGNALARVAARLGEPLGAIYSEDLLTSLFSRFCVGK